MTPLIDLMPPPRRRARLVRRRVRQWLRIVALAAGIVIPVAGLLHKGVDPVLDIQRRDALLRLNESRAQLSDMQARRDGLDRQRRISELIARRPEYTRLVNAVGGVVGEQIALGSITIGPSGTSEDSAHAMVTIDGFAQSHVVAQQFVVRLEGLGIYVSVSLAESQRRSTVVGDLVAFRVVAILHGATS